ncbi:sensor domain-containing diguanylate cyclase [Motilibacter deserti]|uniref:Diguanylate cyclase n=1 Tax=Motilibacter deserti TaxID=2714956 RepID=A0ABX0GNM2_9ACTN|nr:sensor domain-containing diguanylate cyclase [Motilibacter deserti]NHC12431.1 diguanylate cyclase [Motilibacter deserti]
MGQDTRFARGAFANAPSAMAICTLDGVVIDANRALGELVERPVSALLGAPLFDITHPDDVPAAHAACAQLNAQGGTMRLQCRLLTSQGAGVPVLVNSRLVAEDGERHIVMVVEDVTELQEAEAHLAHLALHDPLTGLANRRLLDDRLTQALGALDRTGTQLAVLFIDLDGFKAVNDAHGHAVGDVMLREVADRLRTVLRAADTASRVGGDEFAVLAVDVTHGQAETLRERLLAALREPIGVAGAELRPSASVGLTMGSAGDSPADVLGRADRAMYDGRGRRRGA